MATLQKGIVKQVLSGDSIVIKSRRTMPLLEKTIGFSGITAPKLARDGGQNFDNSKDEPYAFEAREYLREKIIGKEVTFYVDYTVQSSGREFCTVFFNDGGVSLNLVESLVSEGLVEVRRNSSGGEAQQKLIELEDQAKAAGKGRWDLDSHPAHIRDIKFKLEMSARSFVDFHKQKPIKAIVEYVRDCCTLKLLLLPSFHSVFVLLSGIKGPRMRSAGSSEPEPYAKEAKFFVESRLLQQNVEVILEGVAGGQNDNLLGTVLHPKGNISQFLLAEGFARCVDWSIGVVTQDRDKLLAAEKSAKAERKWCWKDFQEALGPVIPPGEKVFSGKVVEVINGDALVIKVGETQKKIFLASVRPPRAKDGQKDVNPIDPKRRPRPLYDVPYLFEAREFLRKKLHGKKVNVTVDYVQPASDMFPEKQSVTVMFGDVNIAEALVSKGLATVIRYKQDDDQRASNYVDLLAAEERAKKKSVGVHSKKEPPAHRVSDVSGDPSKAKQFLPFLVRAKRVAAVVEFVASGSRFRVYIPRETCLITLLLSGIQCPRASRQGGPGNVSTPAEPFGEEAFEFSKSLCLQKEVEVEVESCDKGGNFVGWMYVDDHNLSVQLVGLGYGKVHAPSAERADSNVSRQLYEAEEKAKRGKAGMWLSYTKPEVSETRDHELEAPKVVKERKMDYKQVFITEITSTVPDALNPSSKIILWAQNAENVTKAESLREQLAAELQNNPPLSLPCKPAKGMLCAARFSLDDTWYRARIERVEKDGQLSVLFVDYGNSEIVAANMVFNFPAELQRIPQLATQYVLACVNLPPDSDSAADSLQYLRRNLLERPALINIESTGNSGASAVTVFEKVGDGEPSDIARSLVREGFLVCENKSEHRLTKLHNEYEKEQALAKKERKVIWRYGDFRQDDAFEFGMGQ